MSVRDRVLGMMVVLLVVCGSYVSLSYIVYAFRHPERPPAQIEWYRMLGFR
jgi:hypothetical protein